MIVRKNNARSLALLAAAGLLAALILSGCSSFGSAVSGAMGRQTQPAAAAAQPTREQLASALVGRESVTVQAGTFSTEHYKYTDQKSGYTGESWISKTVPGSMVKFIGTNPKNERTSNGELMQIENGVTTVLDSF